MYALMLGALGGTGGGGEEGGRMPWHRLQQPCTSPSGNLAMLSRANGTEELSLRLLAPLLSMKRKPWSEQVSGGGDGTGDGLGGGGLGGGELGGASAPGAIGGGGGDTTE